MTPSEKKRLVAILLLILFFFANLTLVTYLLLRPAKPAPAATQSTQP